MDGFILAGGSSTRMGECKAELVLHEVRFIDRAVKAVSGVARQRVVIIGGTSRDSKGIAELAPDLPLLDSNNRCGGPIIGLYTALLAATTDRIAVLACDMPMITKEGFWVLANIEMADYDAVVPIQSDGIAQPLCAIYRRSQCLSSVKELIQQGNCSLQSLLLNMNTRFVAFTEFEHIPGAGQMFLNVNSARDFQAALKAASALAYDDPIAS